MKKFIISIKYSWGDEEEPIEIKRETEEDAFKYMLDIAHKETEETISCWPEYDVYLYVKPYMNMITLCYGHDNTECYYELKEI